MNLSITNATNVAKRQIPTKSIGKNASFRVWEAVLDEEF
jgi:hypothetical protein